MVIPAAALAVRIVLTRGHGGPCAVPLLEPWRLVGLALLGGAVVAAGSAVGRLTGRLFAPATMTTLP